MHNKYQLCLLQKSSLARPVEIAINLLKIMPFARTHESCKMFCMLELTKLFYAQVPLKISQKLQIALRACTFCQII